MKKYIFTSEELFEILDATIDRFMDYQYQLGYEEPRARTEAIMDVMTMLDEEED